MKQKNTSYLFKVWECAQITYNPKSPNHSLYQVKLSIIHPYFPKGNFERNQLPNSSISLSPLYQSQTSDLHVSINKELPSEFPLTLLRSGIDHCFSGLIHYASSETHLHTCRIWTPSCCLCMTNARFTWFTLFAFTTHFCFKYKSTCIRDKLLGPCFKTGHYLYVIYFIKLLIKID